GVGEVVADSLTLPMIVDAAALGRGDRLPVGGQPVHDRGEPEPAHLAGCVLVSYSGPAHTGRGADDFVEFSAVGFAHGDNARHVELAWVLGVDGAARLAPQRIGRDQLPPWRG